MSRLDASKVIESLNLKEIAGRPVAIDWALAKAVYESAKSASGWDLGLMLNRPDILAKGLGLEAGPVLLPLNEILKAVPSYLVTD